jgi:hypothetical protein
MFICLYKDSNQLINSVHHYWIHQRAVLKNHAHKDSLLCQMCNEPLNYRSGPIRQPHFAHRPDSTCPFQGSDSNLEETTAKIKLFQILEPLLGENVQMDVLLDGETTTIDILISNEGKPITAFWLMSKDRKMANDLVHLANKYNASHEFIYTRSKHILKDDTLELSKMQRDNLANFALLDQIDSSFRGHLTCIDVNLDNHGTLSIYRGLKQCCAKIHEFRKIRTINLESDGDNNPCLNLHHSKYLISSDEVNLIKENEEELKRREAEEIRRRDREKKQSEINKIIAIEQLEAEEAERKASLALKKHLEEKEHQSKLAFEKRQEQERWLTCHYCNEKVTEWITKKKHRKCVCLNCEPRHLEKRSELRISEENTIPISPITTNQPSDYSCRLCGKIVADPSSYRESDRTCECSECSKNRPKREIKF